MRPEATTELYGLLGHPVAHSLSPTMHNAWFRALGRDALYLALDVEPSSFAAAFAGLAPLGFRGLNVTYPHKGAVLAAVAEASEDARLAGGVNCLRREGEGWIGENTDGEGFCLDLETASDFRIHGSRIVVLGAGAAARSVMGAMIRRNPGHLCAVNRREGRLNALPWAEGIVERVVSADEATVAARLGDADLVVHATPWGLAGATWGESPWPLDRVRPEALAMDLNYVREGSTLFLSRVPHVRRKADGLGMLVRQAALSQEHWTGRRPELDLIARYLGGRVDSRDALRLR